MQSDSASMGFRCLGFLLLLFLTQANASVGHYSTSLQNEFSVSWAADHVNFLRGGQELQLKLDQNSGSGFTSKKKYLFGNISMQIKLVPGDSAGTVTAYYLSSEGVNHDELDFEFLGNKSGEPYVLQTNVYASGKGDREQRIYLWFDPTKDFHSYGVLWTPQHILFMVDGVPIRVFKNNKAVGVPYPESQAMGVYSSLWNGDSWATQGGLVKIDWSHAPFVAAYRNFQAHNSFNERYQTDMLSPAEKKKLWWVKKNYMIYDYCNDKQRYPVPPPECTINL
ncbi:xyloglucan endotransglucosylase/hydrolase 2 [Cryptomeria japonica]|uniref:xyloglucan endotransglucosylase/hydrolase 2 n=1 Tax=Cryptomeria japonica TaxID=3369 RepID=UPI0025ACCA0E|nr:xyloglucan endotransglucosylase/hydrolase 2 [Cryptomeria japonica]